MKRARRTLGWTVAAAVAFPGIALAQDPPADSDAAAEPATDDTPAADAEATETSPAAGTPNAPFARISDDEETIYAIQRKAYLVNQKWELTPLAAASFTDRFVQSFGPAASITFHAAENFGFEAYFAKLFPTESGLTKEILAQQGLTPETAKLTQMLWAGGIGVQWSPIYGKIQIFGASLGNFGFYLGAGFGVGQTRVQCTQRTMLDPNEHGEGATCPELPEGQADDVVYEPASFKIMGALSGGVRFYFSNTFGLKFEVKDYIFTSRVYRPEEDGIDQRYSDAVRNNIFAQMGLSILLGGVDN